MYDATHHLGAYAVTDSLYEKTTVVTELFRSLMEQDSALCKCLLKGQISACDTIDRTQHRLTTFIPAIDPELSKQLSDAR